MHEGWSDWELLEPLSSGASGVVYRACRRGYPEYQSAIKMINIPPDQEETEELRQAGMSEEQIRNLYQRRTDRTVAGIRRMERFKGMSNLVSIEDFRVEPAEDETGSRVYVRMEYLKPLPAYLADKRMEENEIIRMGIDLCKALEILHGSGVIHQDIKPDNIFVNDRLPNEVIYKLGDLDTMRDTQGRTEGEEIRGTPSYLAPEIPEGHAPDIRTDLYELGLTLYQIANDNRLPFLPSRQFSSHHDLEIATQMRFAGTEIPMPLNVSAAFFDILRKACAFRPEERYASATEMRAALEALLKEGKAPVAGEQEAASSNPKVPGAKATAKGKTGSEDFFSDGRKARKARRKKRIAITAVLLLVSGIIAVRIQDGWILRGKKTGDTGKIPEETTEAMPEDPPAFQIQKVYQETKEKRVLPDQEGCNIPLKLDRLPALLELDAWLAEQCGKRPLEETGFYAATIEGKTVYAWKNDTGRQSLEARYNGEAGEMTEWNLVFLLEDRANGWIVNRETNGGWRLRWDPPLRTTVTAEYSADGNLLRIKRGNRVYEIQDGLPNISGVEYLQ